MFNSHSASPAKSVMREGWLKRPRLVGAWQKVFAKVGKSQLQLFKRENDTAPKSTITLKRVVNVAVAEDETTNPIGTEVRKKDKQSKVFEFEVQTAARTYRFQANSESDAREWVRDLRAAVARCASKAKETDSEDEYEESKNGHYNEHTFDLPAMRSKLGMMGIDLTELGARITDPDAGIALSDIRKKGQLYCNCFSRTACVEWLVNEFSEKGVQEFDRGLCIDVGRCLLHMGLFRCLTKHANFSGDGSLYAFSPQSRSALVSLATTSSLFSTSTLDIFNSQHSLDIMPTYREARKTISVFLRDSNGKASDKKNSTDKDDINGSGGQRSARRRTSPASAVLPAKNLKLLPGEEGLLYEPNILLSYDEDLATADRGPFVVTNFRLILSPEAKLSTSIALGLIFQVRAGPLLMMPDGSMKENVVLSCKDLRDIFLVFPDGSSQKRVLRSLKSVMFPATIQDLFAFAFKESYEYDDSDQRWDWRLYSVMSEFTRIQLSKEQWRVSCSNEGFALCPTYPRRLIVPIATDDAVLIDSARLRQQGRMVAFCWQDRRSGGILLRGGDIMVKKSYVSGSGSVRIEAEGGDQVVQAILRMSTSPTLHIFYCHQSSAENGDCSDDNWTEERPADDRTTESTDDSDGIIPSFLGLPTAAILQSSLISLIQEISELSFSVPTPDVEKVSRNKLAKSKSQNSHSREAGNAGASAGTDSTYDPALPPGLVQTKRKWDSLLARVRWTRAVKDYLEAALKVAHLISLGRSVMVQNDEGKDAVTIVVSLAQLLHDPYYRTVHGFAVLVEKEWNSFGHEWGQSNPKKHQKRSLSAVFLLFVDCVHQLWIQYPHHFEFNEAFLIFLMDSVYSHQFGNFLADNERMRISLKIERGTKSIWSFIGGFRKDSNSASSSNKALFLNPAYDTATSGATEPLIVEVGHVSWWGAYFLRWKCNANLKNAVRHIYEEKIGEDERQQEDEDDQALILRGRGLHIIPPEISTLKRITEIDLRGNILSSFTLTQPLPPYVRILRLAHNPLRFIQPHLVSAILRLEYLDTLDLSFCQLRSFPSILRLEQQVPTQLLSCLKELNLRKNRLSALPATFRLLTKLETLDLAYNRFGSATSDLQIEKLAPEPTPRPASKRSSLSLRSSSVKRIIDNSGGKDTLKRSMGSSLTASVTEAIGSLTTTNPRSRSSTPISPPSSDIIVSALPLRTRHLFQLLSELPNLTFLSLAGNGLVHLSPSLLRSISSRLRTLELQDNAQLQLWHSLARLEHLEVINFNNCASLSLLPGELLHTKMASSLREIHARNCGLGGHAQHEVGTLLQRIKQWKRNNFGADTDEPDTLIDSVPTLSTASSLQNEGDIFHYWHTSRLVNLRLLDLASNNLGCAPSAVFGWSRIEILHLEDNGLAQLPPEIKSLADLRQLYLQNNRLQQLPVEIGSLRKLRVLDVSGNRLESLPLQLSILPELKKFKLFSNEKDVLSVQANGENPLPALPKDVVTLGSKNVLILLGQLMRGSRPCRRIKAMFLGQKGVGKTSLLRCLAMPQGGKPVSRATKRDYRLTLAPNATLLSADGIQISDFTTKMSLSEDKAEEEITISAWDFSGQKLYYTAHSFFLSERSLYFLVFNLANVQQSNIEFWLQSIHSVAKESPIIMVGTHADDPQCTEPYLKAILQWFEDKFRPRFPTIKAIRFVSALDGRNITELLSDISSLIRQQKFMADLLPSNYLEFEKALLQRGRTTVSESQASPTLMWTEYQQMAKLFLIEDKEDLKNVTTLLHNLGSIIHFPHNRKLRGVVVLHGQWLIDLMATIMNTRHDYIKDGILRKSSLSHIWKPPRFPEPLYPFMIALLDAFEVSFDISGKHDSSSVDSKEQLDAADALRLIPSLLPEDPPADLDTLWPIERNRDGGESQFGREYRFRYLPAGFFGRLMIRLLSFPLKAKTYWRNGMLASMGREKILIRFDPDKQILNILVRTELEGAELRTLSWLVFTAVDSLVYDWYELSASVFIPCTHCLDSERSRDVPYLFTLEECQLLATTAGRSFTMCYSGGTNPVRLDTLVPDLAMVQLEDYRVESSELVRGEEIGQGGYATVYKGKLKDDVVAIKVLNFQMDSEDSEFLTEHERKDNFRKTFEEFRHEVWIMSGLQHPNIVPLKGFSMEPCTIITEYIENGSLYDFILKEGKHQNSTVPYTWPLRLKLAKDIAKGCAFLHSASPPVIHRDLKSPNILLCELSDNASVLAKVCDFGLASSLSENAGRKVACPFWLAPEVIEGKRYSEKADVYSAGVIFWEIASRKRFFSEIAFLSQVEDMVIAGERPPIPQDCLDEVPEFADVIRDCWQNEPSARPSFKQVVERITSIVEKYFPEVANYDAPAIRAYQDAQNDRNALDRKRMEAREAQEQQRSETLQQAHKLEKSLAKSLHKEVSIRRHKRKKKKSDQGDSPTDTSASGDQSDDPTSWTTGSTEDDEEETEEATEGTAEEEEEEEVNEGSAILADRKKDQQHENLTKLMQVFLNRRTEKPPSEFKQRRPMPRPLTASQSYSFLPIPSSSTFKAAESPRPAPRLGALPGRVTPSPLSPTSITKSQTSAFLPITELDSEDDEPPKQEKKEEMKPKAP